MKKLIRKSILIFLCLLCSFDVVFGQNTTDTTLCLELLPDSTRLQINLKSKYSKKDYTENIKRFWIEEQSIFVTCKNTKENIDKVIKAVGASADVQQITIEQTDEQVEEPAIMIEEKSNEKYNREIDLFLNIEDESIFSDTKFMFLDKQQLHPRSYKYYCLIRCIYEFGKKLKTVQLNGLQQPEQSKTMVDEMSALAEQISSDEYKLERTWLSQKQKDYYNQLHKKYEEIWYIFNK